MLSRRLPSVRDLVTIVVTVLLTLSFMNLFRTAEAGDTPSPTTDIVFVATGANFPDALGAAAAAGAMLSPVLLVQQNSVPAETLAELNRLSPGTIVIVGGTAVISESVKATLEGLAFAPIVMRAAGDNRYATAAALSEVTFPTTGLYPVAAHAELGDNAEVTAVDQVLESVTLTAPVDGTVIANWTANVNESSPGDDVRCSITTGSTIDFGFFAWWESPGPDGDSTQMSGTRGFDVGAGQELTINLVCDHFGSSGSSTIWYPAVTAIFVADI